MEERGGHVEGGRAGEICGEAPRDPEAGRHGRGEEVHRRDRGRIDGGRAREREQYRKCTNTKNVCLSPSGANLARRNQDIQRFACRMGCWVRPGTDPGEEGPGGASRYRGVLHRRRRKQMRSERTVDGRCGGPRRLAVC